MDIHDRIYKFVISVIKLIKFIPKTPENLIIIKQLIRSATSVGANDREADGATTKKDFVHKYSLVRKEAKETEYWLSILRDTIPKTKTSTQKLVSECQEIIKIVSSIIYKTKNKAR